jgi:hypothetical protein
MNQALAFFQRTNPELYSQFIHLLIQDLGVESDLQSNNFQCPNCGTALTISKGFQQEKARIPKSGPATKRDWRLKPNSLFDLLVRVARLNKMTTGKVSAEFNKVMKSKIRGRNPKETREIKIKWLKSQLSKGRRRVA